MNEQQYLDQVLLLRRQLYAVAIALLRSDPDAADAVQETVLSGWKHRRSLLQEDRFRPWLMRILVNKCRDIQRRRLRDRRLTERIMTHAAPPSPTNDLYELVCQLPDNQRLPVLFYYFDGYSQREIAHILDLEPEQVKTRVRQGRQTLRKWMTEGGFNDA